MMLTLRFNLNQAKGMFFDRPAITNAMSKATRQALSKFGSFVRTRARTSIRKRKRASDPGQPPSSHTGLLRRNIFFGYDRQRESVVIGPTKLNAAGRGSPTIPAVIEEGGRAVNAKGRGIIIAPRPYMKPAYDAELPNVDRLWQNALTK
jgi:hypothetical protein